MTETFIPAGQGPTLEEQAAQPVNQTQGYMQAVKQPEPRAINQMVSRDPGHSAQLALAQEVMAQPSFTELMQRSSSLEQRYRALPTKVTDEAGFRAVSEMFAEAKDVYNTAEEIRKTAIAFPDKYVRMVNKLIKETLKDPMDLVKKGAGRKRDDWLAELRAEAEKQAADVGAADNGVSDLDDETPPVATPPPNVTQTTHGSVHQRDSLTIEVDDPMKLLKAIVSTSKNNAMYTHDLVEFKPGALREMVTANPRKNSWPGLIVKREKKSV